MDPASHNQIVSFIWGIADDVLRDVYVRGKYRDVILPMTVIRRLDAVLEPGKQAVLEMKKRLDAAKIANQGAALRQAAGQAFYNASPFTLRDLRSRAKAQQLKADFEAFLDGFSPNVQEILDKFKFRHQLPTLVEADILGQLLEKFLDPAINLAPAPVLSTDGAVRLPALDNHAMGTVFEELIRRFNEENNEEAGEHFTPRDVVQLMADLILLPVVDRIESATYTVYDAACGTGGMLTVTEERLLELARQHGKEVSIHLFGQEVNPETYAITKADLLLKGEGEEAENFTLGSTLSQDGFPAREFDFMLSNPPYGKSWKTDIERMGGKDGIRDPRFIVQHADEPEFSLLTRSSDGQLMFLVNKLAKMKHGTVLGSRIAEVHNGSSLFTGDAGQGESNIRRWIVENDWLEAIIALPLNLFYNTGIATYIWVLTNRKAEQRKGRVQLIDATNWFAKLRKNFGQKNCELSAADRQHILDVFLRGAETEQAKVFANEEFLYWKLTVERPLRLRVMLDDESLRRFREVCAEAKDEPLTHLVQRLAEKHGPGPHDDFNAVSAWVEEDADQHSMKLTAKRWSLLKQQLATREETAAPVLAKKEKLKPGGTVSDDERLHGWVPHHEGKTPFRLRYEPDTDLRDTENVPHLHPGGIPAYMRSEVLPHVPDAWLDAEKTTTGCEISFTRYFHQARPLRSLAEIRADILALEQETEGLLHRIVDA